MLLFLVGLKLFHQVVVLRFLGMGFMMSMMVSAHGLLMTMLVVLSLFLLLVFADNGTCFNSLIVLKYEDNP